MGDDNSTGPGSAAPTAAGASPALSRFGVTQTPFGWDVEITWRGDVAENGPIDAPDEHEVSEAVRTLLRYGASRSQEAFARAVDGLGAGAGLDADRLYQARLHAELRRRVIAESDLLSASEIARLLPDRAGVDSNTGRAIDRLRERGELVAVKVREQWRYPSGQVSAKGRVFDPLPTLVRSARAQRYDDFELVAWLISPTRRTPAPYVGSPICEGGPPLTPDEILERVDGPVAAETLAPGPSPFELLAAGDLDGFARARTDWLG